MSVSNGDKASHEPSAGGAVLKWAGLQAVGDVSAVLVLSIALRTNPVELLFSPQAFWAVLGPSGLIFGAVFTRVNDDPDNPRNAVNFDTDPIVRCLGGKGAVRALRNVIEEATTVKG